MIVRKGEVISLMNGVYDEDDHPMIVLKDFDLKAVAESLTQLCAEKSAHQAEGSIRDMLLDKGYLKKLDIWSVSLTVTSTGVELDVFRDVRVVRQTPLSA